MKVSELQELPPEERIRALNQETLYLGWKTGMIRRMVLETHEELEMRGYSEDEIQECKFPGMKAWVRARMAQS